MEKASMQKSPAESGAFSSLENAQKLLGVDDYRALHATLGAKLSSAKGREEIVKTADPTGKLSKEERDSMFTRLNVMNESLSASIDASKKMEAPENKGILRRVGGHLWRNKGKYILGATAAAVVGAHLLSFNLPAAIEGALSSVPYDKVKDFIASLLPLGKGTGVVPGGANPGVPGVSI